jgi:hypothetical protein
LASAPALADRASDVEQNNKAVQAYNAGDDETAALTFNNIAESGSSEELRLKAEYYLAQSYFKRVLSDAALRQHAYVIKAGPNHPHYLRAVEGVVEVSEALHEDFVTGAILDKEWQGRVIDASAGTGTAAPGAIHHRSQRFLLRVLPADQPHILTGTPSRF